jgi:hypothetical protein
MRSSARGKTDAQVEARRTRPVAKDKTKKPRDRRIAGPDSIHRFDVTRFRQTLRSRINKLKAKKAQAKLRKGKDPPMHTQSITSAIGRQVKRRFFSAAQV